MDRLRALPSIDRILREEAAQVLLERYPRAWVVEEVRRRLGQLRASLLAGGSGSGAADLDEASLLQDAARSLEARGAPSHRKVINATGVILHTNLGRSVLAPAALSWLLEAVGGYSNLELDLGSGRRGSRHDHLSALLTELTGAPAALVVNNCAAAVMLAVDTLARGREVIVSRGELIEIGGSYRLPEVVVRSGGRLVEVGTTNRTYLSDYRSAVTDQTGLIMVSHPSNYRVEGFAHRPDPAEVASLGRAIGIPTFYDLGSGLLVEPSRLGISAEPSVRSVVEAGFDLVAFSGDKLLGGPQAGLLLGAPGPVRSLAANPLARAVRVDKMTLAALEGTLRLYQDPERAVREVPTLAMLAADPARLEARTEALATRLRQRLAGRAEVERVEGRGSVGGGSLPGQPLSGPALRLSSPRVQEADWLARLRGGRPAVLAVCRQGALVLDLRTVLEGEEGPLLSRLEEALSEAEGGA